MGMRLTVATWNISCGISKDLANQEDAIDYIASCLAKNNVDVASFQEVPVYGSGRSFCEKVCDKTGLMHCKEFSLSKSHLLENADMGLAVISKFPVTNFEFFPLPDLGLTAIVDGVFRYSHQKGFFRCDILAPGPITLFAGHCPSFDYFSVDPLKYRDAVFKPLEDEIVELSSAGRAVIMGDLNVEHLEVFMPKVFNHCKSLITGPTRSNGKMVDYILISDDIKAESAFVEKTVFDHYCCIADIIV